LRWKERKRGEFCWRCCLNVGPKLGPLWISGHRDASSAYAVFGLLGGNEDMGGNIDARTNDKFSRSQTSVAVMILMTAAKFSPLSRVSGNIKFTYPSHQSTMFKVFTLALGIVWLHFLEPSYSLWEFNCLMLRKRMFFSNFQKKQLLF